MFSNGRKTIGVFAFRTMEEYQNDLCRGITDQATEMGYNVVVFSAFGRYAKNDRFVEGERQILYMTSFEDLDGVILLLDSIDIEGFEEELIEQVKYRCHCPVVCVRKSAEDFHSILIDDDISMEGIIRHFIEEHDYERLCFMTGRRGEEAAEKRLGCFLRVMNEFGLPVTRQQVFYGDFWRNKAGEACDWFMQDDYKPQVILCANDYMAISVCSELIERGYSIPEDICVSGYDGILEAQTFYPSITTVRVPFYEMGIEAVDLIDRHQDPANKSLEKVFFPTKLILNDSCGCYSAVKERIAKNRRDNYVRSLNEKAKAMECAFMAIDLDESDSLEALSKTMTHFINRIDGINGYDSYFVCLFDKLDEMPKERMKSAKNQNDMKVRLGIRHKEPMGVVDIPFTIDEILPAEVTDDKPQVFFIIPLHFNERIFGYEAMSFVDSDKCGDMYLPWSANIHNAIENILMNREMNRLIKELEYMYVRDVLTGLMNRRGFDKFGNDLFEIAMEMGESLFVMSLDMDCLKKVNDTYGHSEGDKAICVIADALMSAATQDEVCARMGGDEFAVIGNYKTIEEVEEFVNSMELFIDEFNAEAGKPYKVGVSYGIFFDKPKKNSNLEDCLRDSDQNMYKNKADKKRKA